MVSDRRKFIKLSPKPAKVRYQPTFNLGPSTTIKELTPLVKACRPSKMLEWHQKVEIAAYLGTILVSPTGHSLVLFHFPAIVVVVVVSRDGETL